VKVSPTFAEAMNLLEGYGLIIIERVIASKAKQSFTVRLPRRYAPRSDR
jgi:hypothetical protein